MKRTHDLMMACKLKDVSYSQTPINTYLNTLARRRAEQYLENQKRESKGTQNDDDSASKTEPCR